ncbi:hypothetical protein ACFQE1_00395 [Halobium palmae]|uniref:Uncharacterized protein n=1 Tax=Halobium palmae TaxID=1776492 RepID=A0ABD5RUC9_9EURY
MDSPTTRKEPDWSKLDIWNITSIAVPAAMITVGILLYYKLLTPGPITYALIGAILVLAVVNTAVSYQKISSD